MKNFLLFLLTVVLSLVLAYPFGYLVHYFFPLGGLSGFIITPEINQFGNGILFAYLFITPIIYQLWGTGKKWTRALIASVPGFLVAVWVGAGYLTWSVGFFVLGILIADIIEQVRRPKEVL